MLYLAGLQDIPAEIHDAVHVDGASRMQKAFHITIPMLRATTFFVATLSMAFNSFQVFENIYVMTQGGPMDSTRVIVYHLGQTGSCSWHGRGVGRGMVPLCPGLYRDVCPLAGLEGGYVA